MGPWIIGMARLQVGLVSRWTFTVGENTFWVFSCTCNKYFYRNSQRRQTPSPSELIRMSMDSKNSSRHSSQNSLLDFDSRQPSQSQSIKPTFDQSQTSFNLTGQSTYPDFSQSHPDIGRPPISQPATSQSLPNTGDLKVSISITLKFNWLNLMHCAMSECI